MLNAKIPPIQRIHHKYTFKNEMGLPRWHSGWESAWECRGHGFEPWSGKIPHATEQLSPCATTTEPAHLKPVLRNKRGHDSERPVHRDEEWPPLAATRESPRTETKTQHSQKIKIKMNLKKKNEMELVKTSKNKKNQERSSRMEEKLLEKSQRNQTQWRWQARHHKDHTQMEKTK